MKHFILVDDDKKIVVDRAFTSNQEIGEFLTELSQDPEFERDIDRAIQAIWGANPNYPSFYNRKYAQAAAEDFGWNVLALQAYR